LLTSRHPGFEVVQKPPPETETPANNKLSLWLYQVTEDEFTRNQPSVARTPAANGGDSAELLFSPLALNLYYLLTPLTDSALTDQELLGKAMEVFHDNALVHVPMEDRDVQELRIVLCRLDLEELTRIWDALRQPYKLSVSYHVRVARIDSRRRQTRARVVERNNEHGQTDGL
jgi:hypothetical protein